MTLGGKRIMLAKTISRPLGLVFLSGLLALNAPHPAAQVQEGAPAPAVHAELIGGGSFAAVRQR